MPPINQQYARDHRLAGRGREPPDTRQEKVSRAWRQGQHGIAGQLQRLRQALGANLDSAAHELCDRVWGVSPLTLFASALRGGVSPWGRQRSLNRTACVNVTSLRVRTHLFRREIGSRCPSPPWETRDRGLSRAFWQLGFHSSLKGGPGCSRDYHPAFGQLNFTQKVGSLFSPWNLKSA